MNLRIMSNPDLEDTKCMCKEFREQNSEGECHCGRFVQVEAE